MVKVPSLPEFANSPVEAWGILSITYKGWLSPRNELAPRIVTDEAAPGASIEAPIESPAILPCSMLSIEAILPTSFSSGR